MTCIAVCIISFQLQITGAREFHASCIDSIEASYGNPQIISDCISEASSRGYTLQVINDGMYDDRPSYKVVLKYKASVLLFNFDQNSQLEGYAR